MRPIDVDKIGLTDFEIITCEGSYKKAFEMLIYKISNAPTVDAVPVIRCRVCRRKKYCSLYRETNDENNFCSWAEGKE